MANGISMTNGISIYPGLGDNTLEENLHLIHQAAACGIKRVFTSLQIPETNVDDLKAEIGTLLGAAREHHMEVISDVSPRTREMLNIRDFSLNAFRMLGITTLRLDDGFSVDDIVKYSHNKQGIRIQLNASTITYSMLEDLAEKEVDFDHIDALHNFYPHIGTGLTEAALVEQNMLLHRFGIGVGAFVPSEGRRRSPFCDGLPTLEDHRNLPAITGARQLIMLGCDSVFIGDSLPPDGELNALGSLPNNRVTISARLITHNTALRDLLRSTFTVRPDEGRDVVRAIESRAAVKKSGITIPAENTVERPKGAVTLDNEGYGRYMGELEIVSADKLPADKRTNVVAQIDPYDIPLIRHLTGNRKFSFRFHDETDII